MSEMPRSGSPAETLSGIGGFGSAGVVPGTWTGSGTGAVGCVRSGGCTGGVTVRETAPILTLNVLMVVTLLPSSGWTVSKVYSVSETLTTLRTRRCSKPDTGSFTAGRLATVWVPARFQRYWPSAGTPSTVWPASLAGKAVRAAGGQVDFGGASGVTRGRRGRGAVGPEEKSPPPKSGALLAEPASGT